MCDVGRVSVAGDVRGPFEDAGVCVAGADVAGLELLKLLLLSKFVGLGYTVSYRWIEYRHSGAYHDLFK